MYFKWILLSLALCTAGYTNAIEIITSEPKNSSVIDADFVKAIFSGRVRYWPNGMPIKVITLPKNSKQHLELCKVFLKTHPRQFSRNWDIIIFSGFGEKPTEVETELEVIEKIKATPGSIGYINSDNGTEGLNVLFTK